MQDCIKSLIFAILLSPSLLLEFGQVSISQTVPSCKGGWECGMSVQWEAARETGVGNGHIVHNQVSAADGYYFLISKDEKNQGSER